MGPIADADADAGGGDALAGCRALVTRERPGRLAALLEAEGAEVVHVPLIEVIDADDGGRDLAEALSDPAAVDWVLVTSPAGARRTVEHAGPAIDAGSVRIGCVGTATAEAVRASTGRPPDLVPDRQTASDLAAAFVAHHADLAAQRVVVAQADRAAPTLADELRDAGHRVRTVVAYRTLVRTPDAAERDRLASADLLLLASGSAATGWVEAFGDRAAAALPPLVVAIGPTTADAARLLGLKVDAVATDHSVQGLVQAAIAAWRRSPRGDAVGGIVADSSAGTPDRRDPPPGG